MLYCITDGLTYIATTGKKRVTTNKKEVRVFSTETAARHYIKNNLPNNLKKIFKNAVKVEPFSNLNDFFAPTKLETPTAKPPASLTHSKAALLSQLESMLQEDIARTKKPSNLQNTAPIKETPKSFVADEQILNKVVDMFEVLVEITENIDDNINYLRHKVSYQDLMKADYDHLFENGKFPAHIRAKLDKQFDKCLRDRRKYKEQLMILTRLKQHVGQTKFQKLCKKYTPNILTKEFMELKHYIK